MNKCVVLTGKEQILCNRDAIIQYNSKIELESGKIVNDNIYVCERHKLVFDEMLKYGVDNNNNIYREED